MTPDEIRALRRKLKLTARKLAEAIDTDEKTVFAWESGERFPTKRHTELMVALAEAGPPPKASSPEPEGLDRLADPDLWLIVRKLAAHPELFAKVRELSAKYDDPSDA